MSGYYRNRLSAEQLKECYDVATPRVRQYLEAELNHVVQEILPDCTVLELGCGYGRVLTRLADKARLLVGVDTSLASLTLGRELLRGLSNWHTLAMDAAQLAFRDRVFDRVLCIQNGISAFHVDARQLLQESIRVTESGGLILYSSYSDKFWEHRIEWFRIQSEKGLVGEIDWAATGCGVIVCRDGFRATTYSLDDFASLMSEFDVCFEVYEIDNSSVFCRITA